MASAASIPSGREPAEPLSAAVVPVTPGLRVALMVMIMAATIMQVLDSTIANVALPHMQAALSASPDTITWVLTSYIVAAAISTPVTGWLGERFGRRRLLLTSVAGFTCASILCGLADSLPMMVLARIAQGMFGAFLAPLGQSLLLDINPRERHANAMTWWGLGVMLAPIMGPVLGGWLTDSFDWRWVFFINVPIGLLTFVGLFFMMPKIPNIPRRFDAFGFIMLFVGIGALQIMLDRGSQLDWFDSSEIVLEALIALGAGWIFIIHTMTRDDTILPSFLFRDRNLALACLFLLVVMGILITSSALLPPMLQRLMGYTAYNAGIVSAPRGVGMMISMLVCGRLVRIVDARILMFAGLAMNMWAVHQMTGFTLDMGQDQIVVSGIIQGCGFGFVLLPLNLAAFATLDTKYRTEAAGLYNLARNIGGSVAIAVMTASMARVEQVSHSDLAARITTQSIPAVMAPTIGVLAQTGGSAFAMLDAEINRQATMISYIDAFYAMFWALACVMPLILLMRPAVGAPDPAHASVVE